MTEQTVTYRLGLEDVREQMLLATRGLANIAKRDDEPISQEVAAEYLVRIQAVAARADKRWQQDHGATG